MCCEGHSLLAITKSHLHFLLLLHPRPLKLAAGHKKGGKGRINSCRRRTDHPPHTSRFAIKTSIVLFSFPSPCQTFPNHIFIITTSSSSSVSGSGTGPEMLSACGRKEKVGMEFRQGRLFTATTESKVVVKKAPFRQKHD